MASRDEIASDEPDQPEKKKLKLDCKDPETEKNPEPKLDCEDPKMEKKPVEFDVQPNSQKMTEIFIKGHHLSIPELKKLIEEDRTLWTKICQNSVLPTASIKSRMIPYKPKILDFLNKTVPRYPTPVEFHVSQVAHSTVAFDKILETEMFCPPVSNDSNHWEFSWWDLKVSKDEMRAARKDYIQHKAKPEERYRLDVRDSFLHKFTTSPVFRLYESRYGNYRFTFPLRELIELYKEQNCAGKEPVLRVFKTSFYLQEIVYAVLIHSPEDNERFLHLPYLDDSQLVRYQDGEIIWHAQAICETHKYELYSNQQLRRNKHVFYVWDQVSVAFHLPKDGEFRKSLKVPRRRLIEGLESCRLAEKNLIRLPRNDGSEAKKIVEKYKKELEEQNEKANDPEEKLKEKKDDCFDKKKLEDKRGKANDPEEKLKEKKDDCLDEKEPEDKREKANDPEEKLKEKKDDCLDEKELEDEREKANDPEEKLKEKKSDCLDEKEPEEKKDKASDSEMNALGEEDEKNEVKDQMDNVEEAR